MAQSEAVLFAYGAVAKGRLYDRILLVCCLCEAALLLLLSNCRFARSGHASP